MAYIFEEHQMPIRQICLPMNPKKAVSGILVAGMIGEYELELSDEEVARRDERFRSSAAKLLGFPPEKLTSGGGE